MTLTCLGSPPALEPCCRGLAARANVPSSRGLRGRATQRTSRKSSGFRRGLPQLNPAMDSRIDPRARARVHDGELSDTPSRAPATPSSSARLETTSNEAVRMCSPASNGPTAARRSDRSGTETVRPHAGAWREPLGSVRWWMDNRTLRGVAEPSLVGRLPAHGSTLIAARSG
jgi:hypothetical protein